MQRYNINNRLAYLSGGVQSAGGMWPSAAAGDWWDIAGETCVAAYQAIGAASLAASYVNLANSGTYDLTPDTAPTWDTSYGWQGNGTSTCLQTGIVPTGGAWTLAVRMSDYVSSPDFNYVIGVIATTNAFLGIRPSNFGNRQYINGGTVSISGRITSGVAVVAGNQGYLDGSSDGGTITAPSATNTGQLRILGATNSSGNPSQYVQCRVQAVAIYSTTLDATQVATLSSAMAAL